MNYNYHQEMGLCWEYYWKFLNLIETLLSGLQNLEDDFCFTQNCGVTYFTTVPI